MNKETLYEFSLELLRHIPENRREIILNSIIEIKDNNSFNVIVENEYNRVIKILSIISSGEKFITGCYSMEYGSYNYYDDGEESIEYDDSHNIKEDIEDAVKVANWLLLKREYKYAGEVYNRINTIIISITVEYDEDNEYYFDDECEFSLEEFIEEFRLKINIYSTSIEELYAIYMVTDKNERANELYNHYGWYGNVSIKLEDLFTIGPEKLPDFELFLIDWIELLKTKSNDNVSKLLEEAFVYLEGKEAYEKYAKELSKSFPVFYFHWFENMFENKDYKKIIDESEQGFEAIENSKNELHMIANIVYASSSKINNIDLMYISSKVMFESKPSVKTFLRLKTLPFVSEICKTLIISDIYINDIIIDENEKQVMMIFNNQWNVVYKELQKNKKAVGWTFDLKGIVVPLFLIMLVEAKDITPLMENILLNIELRINFNRNFDDMEFIEYYKLWRSSIEIEDVDCNELYLWCKNEINNRVSEIVSKGYRKAYIKAATGSQLLSEVSYIIGKTSDLNEISNGHKSKFPRHIAFKREYENL